MNETARQKRGRLAQKAKDARGQVENERGKAKGKQNRGKIEQGLQDQLDALREFLNLDI